jgi:hypothetical protein
MQTINESDIDAGQIELETTVGEKRKVLISVSFTDGGYMFQLHSNGSYKMKIGYYKHLQKQQYDKSTQEYVKTYVKLDKYINKIINIDANRKYYHMEFPYLYGWYKNDEDQCLFLESIDILQLKYIGNNNDDDNKKS